MGSQQIPVIPEEIQRQFRLTFGADPEFILGRNTNGKATAVSAHKVADKQSSDLFVYRDGFNLELGVDPEMCNELFVENIYSCLIYAKRTAGRQKLNLLPKCAYKINKKELDEAPEDVRILGCDPSLNFQRSPAKLDRVNASKLLLRTAGGHLHLGFDSSVDKRFCHQNAKQISDMLDYTVGLASVIMNPAPEEKIRRKYYGRAGECRLPRHGIEYRTLSNFWILNPRVAGFITSLARSAVLVVFENREDEVYRLVKNSKVVKAINKVDDKAARKLIYPIFVHLEKLYANRNIKVEENYYKCSPLVFGAKVAIGFIEWAAKNIYSNTTYLKSWSKSWNNGGSGHNKGPITYMRYYGGKLTKLYLNNKHLYTK